MHGRTVPGGQAGLAEARRPQPRLFSLSSPVQTAAAVPVPPEKKPATPGAVHSSAHLPACESWWLSVAMETEDRRP